MYIGGYNFIRLDEWGCSYIVEIVDIHVGWLFCIDG